MIFFSYRNEIYLFQRIVDTDEHRLYWINQDGDMKSAKDDGSDVNKIISTNSRRNYVAICVFGSYIYFGNGNHLYMVNKVPESTPTLLYSDTSRIESIFVFKQTGMLTAIYYIKRQFENPTSL